MGIFTNIKDNIKVASLSKKEGPFRIEELAKLNEKQLMKLLNKKGSIEIYLVTYKKYYFKDIDIISKIIKLSQLPDFDKIKNIIIEFDNNDLVNIFKNNDINSIKEVLQEEYLNNFLLGKNKMNIEYLEPEFIDKNKDKLLIGKLPSELLKKFYRKALTNDDIFNNIELFSSIELFKEYNLSNLVIDDYLKLLLSKINLDGLNEILNNQRDVFLDKFKYYTTNTNT